MKGEQLSLWPELGTFYRKVKNIDWVDVSTISDDPKRKADRQLSALPTGKYILFKTGGSNIYLKERGLVFPYIKNTISNIVIIPKGHGTDAYPRVHFYNEKTEVRFNFKIHRLVALSFIENPDNKPIVHHINESIMDYRLDNLDWATYSENSKGTKRGAFRKVSGTVGENMLNLAKRGNGL